MKTGVKIENNGGFRIMTKVTAALAIRGIVQADAPGCFESGEITAVFSNMGREIVEIKDGDAILECWTELLHNPNWETL